MNDDLMTVAEAARALGISPQSVTNRLRAGHMKGQQLTPRMWVITRAEVDRVKAQGRLKPGPARRPD